MPDDLADDEIVSQYVFFDSEPRCHPRPKDQGSLSALRGRLTVQLAAKYVRTSVRIPFPGDTVRHAQIGELRTAGFTVTHTPHKRSPLHVSISCEAQWTPGMEQSFDACFHIQPDETQGGSTE